MRTWLIQLDNIDETLRWTAASAHDRRTLQRTVAKEAHSLGAQAVQVVSHDGQHVLYSAVFVDAPVEDDKHLQDILIPFEPVDPDLSPTEAWLEFKRRIAALSPAAKAAALTELAALSGDPFDEDEG